MLGIAAVDTARAPSASKNILFAKRFLAHTVKDSMRLLSITGLLGMTAHPLGTQQPALPLFRDSSPDIARTSKVEHAFLIRN
jgi:hypothetical protein